MKKIVWLCLLLLTFALPALGEESCTQVAENGRLVLSVSEDLAGVEILDKATGTVWSSSMNDETFAGQKINAMWQKKMNSLLMVNYTNVKSAVGVINNTALLADKQYSAAYELIENGVRIHYELGSCDIALNVEITLEGDSVLVRVPYDGIEERGQFSIVSLDMLPFLCSASDFAEGYFLYPDGSGALMDFQDNAHMNEKTKLYSVYGNLEKHASLLPFLEQKEPEVMLPVFGMNRGGQGILTVIEEGDESCRISLNCSNNIIRMNYIFANFLYRRGFDDKRVTDRSLKIYDSKAIASDYAVRLLFLPEDQGDYSTMACTYRDYLEKRGVLASGADIPGMALDIFMTTSEDGLMWDTPRTVTTMAQAEDMLDAFAAAGIKHMAVSLKGWAAKGYGKTPDRFPVSGAVGGDKALQSLLNKADALNYPVSLTVNLLEADAEQRGYSKRNDVVYTGNFAILTDEDEEIFLLAPGAAREKFDELMKTAGQLNLKGGLRFEHMGGMLPYNYGSRRYTTTAQARDIFQAMLAETKETFGGVSVQGGAAYTLESADILTEIPHDDYGYQFTTRSVPFYQMVMHGHKAYTGTPGNLSSDMDREVLRWVEMGYVPYFELTCGNTEELMYTDYQRLFTAQYTAWMDRVLHVAQIFDAQQLATLRTAKMLRHDVLAEEVVRVQYDNGMTVYVNYNEHPVTADGVKLDAMAYLVQEGRGGHE